MLRDYSWRFSDDHVVLRIEPSSPTYKACAPAHWVFSLASQKIIAQWIPALTLHDWSGFGPLYPEFTKRQKWIAHLKSASSIKFIPEYIERNSSMIFFLSCWQKGLLGCFISGVFPDISTIWMQERCRVPSMNDISCLFLLWKQDWKHFF